MQVKFILWMWLLMAQHPLATPQEKSEENIGSIAIIEPHLLVTTLDGSFYSIGKRSGLINWSFKEDSIVKVPYSPQPERGKMKMPLFLPDPKDGSLYRYNGISAYNDKHGKRRERDVLEKFPFTLNELVSASPCRSSDGLLYIGKKTDAWVLVDKETGEKLDVMNAETPMCPRSANKKGIEENQTLLLARSEIHLSVFDLKSKQKMWNLTVTDYSNSANLISVQNNYDLLHLTSSKTGRIATFDVTATGGDQKILWTHQLGSPIIQILQYNDVSNHGQMVKIPFTTIGEDFTTEKVAENLYPTLYIGESNSNSLYALTALVDITETPVVARKRRGSSVGLIEGPKKENESRNTEERPIFEEFVDLFVYGFYEYPEFSKTDVFPQLTIAQLPKNNLLTQVTKSLVSQKEDVITAVAGDDRSIVFYQDSFIFLVLFSLVMVSSITLVVVIYGRRKLVNQRPPKNVRRIGKICFDPSQIIGRGSAGTCVYKGLFENKQNVAIKRVISDCFVVAEREIELLRSLQHPNLVRYFATETDDMFQYIAIELAEASLLDVIENRLELGLDYVKLLHEAAQGVQHLHSLNVIHRDIKPGNVLISVPLAPSGKRKVLISDFGVSKALSQETSAALDFVSTTKVIRGTEGWIAPEVLLSKLNKGKASGSSKPIDVFSLGCLFYYVLSNGKHPFGDPLERQSNIIKQHCNLTILSDEENLIKVNLIETMVVADPYERPTIETITCHPLFWSKEKQLQFFLDLSDRIEKEPYDSEIVRSLEKGGFDVVKGDWRRHITAELQSDLRKFRSYKGNSVRDLLRALRNKRHHYRELPPEVQTSLGSIPNEFLEYFTSRFPRLLVHAYIAMYPYKFEDAFKPYYDQETAWHFSFPPLPRTGVRWYDMNTFSGKNKLSYSGNESGTSDQEFVFAPNGFSLGGT